MNKVCTTIEQSKKLAEFLPIESADMHYNDWSYDFLDGYEHTGRYKVDLGTPKTICGELDIPCWSLAALLEVTNRPIVINKEEGNKKYHFSSSYKETYVKSDNPIDACVEMIIRLNELNLL